MPAFGYSELNGAQVAKLSRMGVRRGWPDFLFVHGGHPYGIELKRPGARLSKTRSVRTKRGSLRILQGQADVHPRLIQAGMTIAICTSVETVLAQLASWGIPLRGSSLTNPAAA
jgi:hypothetical protein